MAEAAQVIVLGDERDPMARVIKELSARQFSIVTLANPSPDQAEVIAGSTLVLWMADAAVAVDTWLAMQPQLLNRLQVVWSQTLAQALLRFDEYACIFVMSVDSNPSELLALAKISQRTTPLFAERQTLRKMVANAQVDQENRDLISNARAIAAAKREWEWIFDTIEHPISLIDRDYRVRRANIAFAQEVLKPIREVINQRCHQIWFQRDTPCEGCPVQKTRESGAEAKGRVESRGRLWEVRAYTDSAEALGGIACSYRDITDEAQQTERMLHNEKMLALGQLAGGVAHEVNNPLSIILAFTQIMLSTQDRPEDDVEALTHIESSAKRCKTIVEQMLKYSRRPDFSVGPVDMSACIESALGLFRVMLKTFPKVRFAPKLPAERLVVNGNSDQLQQVLLNLLTNALQSLPGGEGFLDLQLNADKDSISITVKDSGCGIPADNLKRIFEPSFTTKPVGIGTGLGLSICKSIVERHGGTIDVKSEVGKGTSFEVRLPNREPSSTPKSPDSQAIISTPPQPR